MRDKCVWHRYYEEEDLINNPITYEFYAFPVCESIKFTVLDYDDFYLDKDINYCFYCGKRLEIILHTKECCNSDDDDFDNEPHDSEAHFKKYGCKKVKEIKNDE